MIFVVDSSQFWNNRMTAQPGIFSKISKRTQELNSSRQNILGFINASDGPKLDEKALIQRPPGLQYEEALQIEYAADVLDVYQIFVIRAIKLSHSSDIICRNWESSVSASVWNLSTWV